MTLYYTLFIRFVNSQLILLANLRKKGLEGGVRCCRDTPAFLAVRTSLLLEPVAQMDTEVELSAEAEVVLGTHLPLLVVGQLADATHELDLGE